MSKLLKLKDRTGHGYAFKPNIVAVVMALPDDRTYIETMDGREYEVAISYKEVLERWEEALGKNND